MKTPDTPTELDDQDLDETGGATPLILNTLTTNEQLSRTRRQTPLSAKVKVEENGDPIFDYPDDFAP